MRIRMLTATAAALLFGSGASAALLTDPNDARTWQGASVGTFAQLFFGSNTLANRQAVIDAGLLDDGHFDVTGFTSAPLIQCNGCITGTGPNDAGKSLDTTGTGSYAYDYPNGDGIDRTEGGSAVDQYWIQTGNQVGGALWDMGAGASTAVIFNTIDHGPLPLEAIESTVYLSNIVSASAADYVQARTQRVWLEGYLPNHGILWDGFTYAVGTPTGATFRYASIIWGGPGALQSDGDNEINGILGANRIFEPPTDVPAPGAGALVAAALAALAAIRRRRQM